MSVSRITLTVGLVCLALSEPAWSAEPNRLDELGIEGYSEARVSRQLDIYSATDTAAIQPVIEAFEAKYPGIDVRYHEYETNQLYQAFINQRLPEADVLISSAMDLQVKLVNDGYVRPIDVPETDALPDWSHWRSEVFGFTFEPAVIAYNKLAFAGSPVPHSHEALVNMLRREPERYADRIGTYDIRKSGVGYLLATQDIVVSSIAGRIQESLARAPARVYCCSSEILEDLAEGRLLLGYNLLGSYALARARSDARIGVIMPEDYTLVMSRVALVPKTADAPAAAETFIRFLLSLEGQHAIAQNSSLVALHPDAQGPSSITAISNSQRLKFHPIKVAPPLMTYQDRMKREDLIREWTQMFVVQGD